MRLTIFLPTKQSLFSSQLLKPFTACNFCRPGRCCQPQPVSCRLRFGSEMRQDGFGSQLPWKELSSSPRVSGARPRYELQIHSELWRKTSVSSAEFFFFTFRSRRKENERKQTNYFANLLCVCTSLHLMYAFIGPIPMSGLTDSQTLMRVLAKLLRL